MEAGQEAALHFHIPSTRYMIHYGGGYELVNHPSGRLTENNPLANEREMDRDGRHSRCRREEIKLRS